MENRSASEEWMGNMQRAVHDALVEAQDLEARALAPFQAARPGLVPGLIRGNALVVEATIREGALPSALLHFQRQLLGTEFEAGCRIGILLDDPSVLDVSFVCLWVEDRPSGVSGARGSARANGIDAYQRLRAAHSPHAWALHNAARESFAAKYYSGGASEGFYPAKWFWLARAPAARSARRLEAVAALTSHDTANGAPRHDLPPYHDGHTGASSDARSTSTVGGGSAGGAAVLAVEGLVATKVMGVFEVGQVEKGVRLFDELLVPQLRSIPGIVAASSLHDVALSKLMMLMVWRSVDDLRRGERLLSSVLNMSAALQPVLREPLLTEHWPDAALFWPAQMSTVIEHGMIAGR